MASQGRVTSADGTPIVYERHGSGEPLILVGGALQGSATYRPLAEELSGGLSVINFDRRGRGDSGGAAPYTVEGEVEDLAALIVAAGGRAALYGHSSGAALVMHAATRDLPVDRVVLHEPPFGSGGEEEARAEQEQRDRISELLVQGRRAEAVRSFLAPMGMPSDLVELLCTDPAMLANAGTLPYDPFDLTGATSRGGRTPAQQASAISVPTLVLEGGASPDWMVAAGRAIAEAAPHGRLHILEGQDHIVPPDVLAPVLTEFVTGS